MATILCVDDDPSVGLILEDTLQRAGHTTIMARHVPEGLHALARHPVDLIISDYRMPGITGLEFLSMLSREGHDVPLIMLTGYASIEHAVTAIKAGAVDYITKPFDPWVLRSKVAVFVDLWATHAQLADRATECGVLQRAIDDALELLEGADPDDVARARSRLAAVRGARLGHG